MKLCRMKVKATRVGVLKTVAQNRLEDVMTQIKKLSVQEKLPNGSPFCSEKLPNGI